MLQKVSMNAQPTTIGPPGRGTPHSGGPPGGPFGIVPGKRDIPIMYKVRVLFAVLERCASPGELSP